MKQNTKHPLQPQTIHRSPVRQKILYYNLVLHNKIKGILNGLFIFITSLKHDKRVWHTELG